MHAWTGVLFKRRVGRAHLPARTVPLPRRRRLRLRHLPHRRRLVGPARRRCAGRAPDLRGVLALRGPGLADPRQGVHLHLPLGRAAAAAHRPLQVLQGDGRQLLARRADPRAAPAALLLERVRRDARPRRRDRLSARARRLRGGLLGAELPLHLLRAPVPPRPSQPARPLLGEPAQPRRWAARCALRPRRRADAAADRRHAPHPPLRAHRARVAPRVRRHHLRNQHGAHLARPQYRRLLRDGPACGARRRRAARLRKHPRARAGPLAHPRTAPPPHPAPPPAGRADRRGSRHALREPGRERHRSGGDGAGEEGRRR
mmetsp:Transcript_1490/g.4804  ORF Transcript_1490/g.4804 Transcript_1490/m.4804 type:complete len:316 (-) Transcript_1490:198-1145(-)